VSGNRCDGYGNRQLALWGGGGTGLAKRQSQYLYTPKCCHCEILDIACRVLIELTVLKNPLHSGKICGESHSVPVRKRITEPFWGPNFLVEDRAFEKTNGSLEFSACF
jgi:hypothetical protein